MAFMKTLSRLIEALVGVCSADGCLVYKINGRAVVQDLRQQRNFNISEEFMGRCSAAWPFSGISPAEADVYGVGEPLAFEDVFGKTKYLAVERAMEENNLRSKRAKKARRRDCPKNEALPFFDFGYS